MKKILALLLIVTVLCGVCSCKIFEKQKAERDMQSYSEIYQVGGIGTPVNTEYDVSQYRVPKGFDFFSSDITIGETEIEEFAGRLETIDKKTNSSIRGKYQDYNFLIVRRDRYDEFSKYNSIGGISYPDGYATVSREVEWEFSAFYTVTTDVYKDPSDKFIIFTNCSDYKVINEFFG